MTAVRFAASAQVDLEEIALRSMAYGAEHALRYLDELERLCKHIAQYPRMGKRRDELVPSIRSVPFDPYVLYYRETRAGIEIIRILHGSRDVLHAFD